MERKKRIHETGDSELTSRLNILRSELKEQLGEKNGEEAWRTLGQAFLSLRRNSNEFSLYKQALSCNPSDPQFWHSLGIVYSILHFLPESIIAHRQAIKLKALRRFKWI